MKKYLIWIILTITIFALASYFFFFRQINNQQYVQTERTFYEAESPSNPNTQNHQSSNLEQNSKPIETEIASFSTEILVDDDNRDTNLELTASKINGIVVKNEETFSFNDTVGNPTPDRGYEKAAIIVDGKKEKGYGGGNCQVSTTLYDTVLKVKGIEIIERHEHGKDVGYVEEGKDATVVYDELDLKFKNGTGYDIKIYAEVTEEKVKVKIMKLS